MKKISVNHFPKLATRFAHSLLFLYSLSQLSLSAAPYLDPTRRLTRSVRSSDSVTADDITDGGDGDGDCRDRGRDFTEDCVEITALDGGGAERTASTSSNL